MTAQEPTFKKPLAPIVNGARPNLSHRPLQVRTKSAAPALPVTIFEGAGPSAQQQAGHGVLETNGLGSFFFDPQSPEQNAGSSQERSIEQILDAGSASGRSRRLRMASESDAEVSFESVGAGEQTSPSTAKAATFSFGTSQKYAPAQEDRSRTLQPGRISSRPTLAAIMQVGAYDSHSADAVLTRPDPKSLRRPPPLPTLGARPKTFALANPRKSQSSLDAFRRASRDEEDDLMTARPGPQQSFFLHQRQALQASEERVRRRSSMEFVSPSNSMDSVGGYPDNFDGNGSPMPAAQAKTLRHRPQQLLMHGESKDDSSPLRYGKGVRRNNSGREKKTISLATATALPEHPAEHMPGFGASEKEGKVLPCFKVKEDGLVRIVPDTLVDLLTGKYHGQIEGFTVIDCRFPYEHEGGHIATAINLNTVEAAKRHFLTPGAGLHARRHLPLRSQSGRPDAAGQIRKHILVFHCEFSCKRGPAIALALRQADRAIAHDWPNCHFPELYILEGGYCNFFQIHPTICQPQAYVRMDDPLHQQKRAVGLHDFRKQSKGTFVRHKTYAYGEAPLPTLMTVGRAHVPSTVTDPSVVMAPPLPVVAPPRSASTTQVEPAANLSLVSSNDDSFDRSGAGESPCAAAGKRKPADFSPGFSTISAASSSAAVMGKRGPMPRATTLNNLFGGGPRA